MPFSPELAEIRFGCGLSPDLAPPPTSHAVLDGLLRPDDMAARFPIDNFGPLRGRLLEVGKLRREARNSANRAKLLAQIKTLRRASAKEGSHWFAQSLQRWVHTEHGFRERLVAFWADHFTAMGKNLVLKFATPAYVEEAIRPHVSGAFADMLIATTTHPLMLHFLDQGNSVGPDSRIARRGNKRTGLNENLAREVLELHTLGVDGPYSQTDVRQLAELFTGLSYSRSTEFKFRAKFAEPGPETVLGKSYGGDPATLEPILQSLRDLAVHPATAQHIAQKLAVHFVSDRPDPALVQHLAGRFVDTGGNLMAVNAALLEHPASWQAGLDNVKPPLDFIASACRALVPTPDRVKAMNPRAIRRLMLAPLALMGQPWQHPNGPDGWTEEDAAWITPQGVSTRLRWALSAPQKLRPNLPDPRRFVTSALGSYATQSVHFAASAAESKSDAIGLVLASPAFQRR